MKINISPPRGDKEREMEARERDFQRFVKHLGESHEGVISASNWLNSLGYSVTIPPSTVSDSYENRMNHVDKGDLYIQDWNKWGRITKMVKSAAAK